MKILQSADFMRKNPKQKRSHSTIDTILEASTQILDADGEKALNTNDIAARSGFSVGTLYQYFRNKEAIIEALVQREMARALDRFAALVRQNGTLSQEDAVRAVVRVLIEPLSRRPRARRALMLFLVKRIDVVQVRRIASDVAATLFERMRYHAHFDGVPSKLRQSLLLSAVMGAVRGTLVSDPDMITSPEFEDELVILILAYLRAPAGGRA